MGLFSFFRRNKDEQLEAGNTHQPFNPDQALEYLKREVPKPITVMTAGGFRPSGELTESWLGNVFLYQASESIPIDIDGNEMMPLAQLYLPTMPILPDCLKGLELITVFMGQEFPACDFEPMGQRWLVRAYESIEGLQRKELKCKDSWLKAFPLQIKQGKNDWPVWDGGGLSFEAERMVLALERVGVVESYYDLETYEHEHDHKVGGYPSLCQSGPDFGEGFELAFQISSDPKINLNVVDGGSFSFWRHVATGEWRLYFDFY